MEFPFLLCEAAGRTARTRRRQLAIPGHSRRDLFIEVTRLSQLSEICL
jgi:hypothetical protein